jgi:hypothetical protein
MLPRLRTALLPTLLALFPGASALELEPGLWTFRTTLQGAFGGDQVGTLRRCIRDPRLDPALFLGDLGVCRLQDVEARVGRLDWSFVCEDPSSTGTGSMYLVDGALRGRVTIRAAMPAARDRRFTLSRTWEGSRLGLCP